jgi:septum formation protein
MENASMHATPPLILASTSRYRRELLERLRMPFETVAPQVDETPHDGEAPHLLSERLALAKAHAVATLHPEAVVIGSDQVVDLYGLAIGKPGTHERAVQQLRALSGRRIVFHTAVSVVRQSTQYAQTRRVPVTVQFRTLHNDEIETYLQAEKPYDCAGSAKSEALGIALLQSIESTDPSALVGLPMIETCAMLREVGIDPLRPVRDR